MSQCYAHILTPTGEKRRCPATARTYRAGVPVCRAHDDKAVTK